MAFSLARRCKPLVVITALGAAAVLAPTLASASPGPRQQPSVTTVQKQLGELALRNSQLVEQFNQARVLVQVRDRAAGVARRAATAANLEYRQANVAFTQMVQAQYESGSLGAAGALLETSTRGDYADRLDTMQLISNHETDVISAVSRAKDTADSRSKQAASLLAAAKAERDGLAAKRDAVTTQIAKYKQLLSTLSSAQQYAFQRANNPALAASAVSTIKANLGPLSAAARRAVQYALDQVGKPYVFGSAGPDSFDCSGLTMMAWQQGGVSLPHSAADQYNYGTHVSRDQLRPGDLVFFYQPIEHVTIYIGDGMMVSAPTEGENVSVVPLSAFNSDYAGATHLG
ncbi:MAG TPA: C40 family peptidase [Jatrophihabitans sp.]|uniref:C40 family peptidase n=1 Tax=Jatrophihabitans sp. TaxID=1932789 RepID=UPI002E069923|nr:C40 family peptidase [Jatrophihabitans sp.]